MAAIAEDLRPAERGFAQLQQDREPAGAADVQAIEATHARLMETFKSGRTKSYEWRMAQLRGMKKFCKENADQMSQALAADLGRPRMEALLADISSVIMEIEHTEKSLNKWMEPESVSTPLLQQPGKSMVVREPKGVVLAIAPWNFPINLSLACVVCAVSAGNCCVVKPSEVAPATERLIKDLLPKYVDSDAIAVVTGGVPETTALLKLRWDHIMYTGNSMVARIVSRAAAEHLTPLTLELGGKSPTIVLPGAKLSQAVKRILAGKFLNCGQICIAPDYILVHKSMEADFVAEIKKTLKEWYGNDARESSSYSRIISENHFRRVNSLIESAEGEVIQQGKSDASAKFIPPTVIRNASPQSAVMQEEIFGPILPIMQVGSTDELVAHINANEKPLAMYIFGTEKDAQEIISRTSSGGVCVNDTIMHCANSNLPFGGVGNSGMGKYHGKWGFNELSHERAVMYRSTFIDVAQRYPPYTEANLKMFEKLMLGPLVPPGMKKVVGLAAVAAGAVVLRSRL